MYKLQHIAIITKSHFFPQHYTTLYHTTPHTVPVCPAGLALLEGTVSLSHMAAMGRFMGYDTGPEERRGRAGRCVCVEWRRGEKRRGDERGWDERNIGMSREGRGDERG